MRNYFTIACLLLFTTISAQTIWDAEIISFAKEDNADWTLEENQDRITDNVWITRGNNQGIFNIASETSFMNNVSPSDTEWSFGSTADIDDLTFTDWQTAVNSNPQGSIDQPMVVHLITDDIYIDIMFTAFTGGGPGGGFAYARASEETLGTEDLNSPVIGMYPNPATDRITITGITEKTPYTVYSILGKEIAKGMILNNESIDIVNITAGVYFIDFSGKLVLKFIKK